MVESPRGCVLQWAGHAGYITERFSGLLARQALVDVTLVCEEQKLRVHKLVLASNSAYFEEILQQDLGQEPIIFLKDLNFEILKAMVEFMYCGETTISHELLPTLLTATKTFKVKELTSVIDSMMASNKECFETGTNSEKNVCGSKVVDSICKDTDCVHVRYSEVDKNGYFLLCNKSSSGDNSNENQSLESNIISDAINHELEHTLYEELQDHESNEGQINEPYLMSSSIKTEEDDDASITSTDYKVNEGPKRCSENSVVKNDEYCTDNELKPILYEQCCDFSDIDECEETSMSLSRSCLQEIEKDFAQYSFENIGVSNKRGKCVKVYTHKRRKSTDEVKNKLTDINSIMQQPSTTDCIDLLDEPSTNDIPVTLLTSLDMESAEYIISLSTENIQTIVGATLSEQHTFNEYKHGIDFDSQKENVNKKEVRSESVDHSDYIKPILRRSLRLNQQETEETVNNNESTRESTGREKHLKKSYFPSKTEFCIKGKRKGKDTDRKVPEQGVSTAIQANRKNLNNSRTHRNSAKLIMKKTNKSTCTVSSKEKQEQQVKTNSRLKCELPEKMEMNSSLFTSSAKLSTIEHINRALWGDMSDISENSESKLNLLEYTNTEIPFAVGLLPLRTALEKMQATPDYQPRKTRSSFAPTKQDNNNFKRKNCTSLDSAILSKKSNNYMGDPKENGNTVCHIQIRTAPSQYIRNRKKFLSSDITTLESATVMSRQ